MKLKIKDRQDITIFVIDTKLNINTEHTLIQFYKDLLDGEHDYEIDMQGTKLENMYKLVLFEDGETLEEIYKSDMKEMIEREMMDEREKEYGESIFKEIEEDILKQESENNE